MAVAEKLQGCDTKGTHEAGQDAPPIGEEGGSDGWWIGGSNGCTAVRCVRAF